MDTAVNPSQKNNPSRKNYPSQKINKAGHGFKLSVVIFTDISIALGSVLTAELTRFLFMGKIVLFLLSLLCQNVEHCCLMLI